MPEVREYFKKKHDAPLNLILVVEIFDVCGINFMRSFSNFFSNVYILVVDYVSKWVKAKARRTNDHKVVV